MPQPDPKRTLDLVESPTAGSGATHTIQQTPNPLVGDPPDNPALPSYFDGALEDAERLLKYAAEVGVDVDDDTRNAILHARSERHGGWSDAVAASLLAALTKLAARLKPVSAESLRACSDLERHTVLGYWKVAIALAAVIVPFSLASFVTSALSDAIRKDIVAANELAVKITSQLHPTPVTTAGTAPTASSATPNPSQNLPPGLTVVEIVTELQQFASVIRSVDGRALRLNNFVLKLELDPYQRTRRDPDALHNTFQLPAELPLHLASAADDRIRVYQDVRYFAQSLLDDVSTFYGAITTCLLPVLYALLGTCAYLLRSFEEQTRNKTFIPSSVNSARFLIAGIGGAVVGLFNNFTITQGASIPPLAIAFLVGYAVDVFFSFLEGLLQAFTKTRSGGPASPTPSSSGTP